ncbi:hydroxymethylglutaryl-CoA lyase [Bacillus sp. JJ1532]|uniref:hydroxymethylglutaryl-CoA lyase n=1 Tax=Bacillus sp. JJ1532 TaxID=3122958 RepID=UPI002FFF7698
MKFPENVIIRDVTLRDGLQNEKAFMETEEKIKNLKKLILAGFNRIEVTSFVHPKWVPALSDADELAQQLPFQQGIEFDALVPNQRGLDRFLNTKIHNAVFFLSASNAHNKSNLNRSTDETLTEIEALIEQNNKAGRKSIGGIATAFVCPFDGTVPYSEVEKIAERLVNCGVSELGVGDTIGKATPRQIYEYCARLSDRFPDMPLSLHLHDTYGYGLANVLAGLQAGIQVIDVAQAGLGGCPYAPGAPGNIEGSKVVDFLEKQNINTGLDLQALKELDGGFNQFLLRKESSKVSSGE